MLKLKLQYLGLLQRADSLENPMMLGKTEARRRRGQGQQRMKWLDGITNSMDMYVHACSDSATLWTVASQVPLTIGFSRQEYGVGCPPPGDLPDPGVKPASLMTPALRGRFFTTSATWEAQTNYDRSIQKEYAWCGRFSRTKYLLLFPFVLKQYPKTWGEDPARMFKNKQASSLNKVTDVHPPCV